MRAAEVPRRNRKRRISNAYDDRRQGVFLSNKPEKRAAIAIVAEVVEQATPRGIRYVPIARCSNGDCLRGCYRECRSEVARIARDLANRLRERFTAGFGPAPIEHTVSDAIADGEEA